MGGAVEQIGPKLIFLIDEPIDTGIGVIEFVHLFQSILLEHGGEQNAKVPPMRNNEYRTPRFVSQNVRNGS